MTMQLKSIILYNKHGEKRLLNFGFGRVNIITGDSRTGKSTLIHIIDYCMGRSSFNIPMGPIRQSVVFYAVVFRIDDVDIFIAKPRPAGDGKSSSEVFYKIASEIEPPELEEIKPFSNDKALIDLLSRRIGINPNKAGVDTENRQFEVTIDHTKYYLFQPENYIKNPNVLFYRQDDEGLAKHIRTTMPYILGAIQDDSLRLSIELREKERELAKLKRELKETQDFTIERANRAQALISESIQVGLLDQTISPNNVEEATQVLRDISANWQSKTETPTKINNQLPFLYQRESTIRERIAEKQQEISLVEEFVRRTEGYRSEASQQVVRLVSIGLFDSTSEENLCPVCSSKLTQAIPSVDAIQRQLDVLDKDLNLVGRERPNLDTHIESLRFELEKLQEERQQIQITIKSVLQQQDLSNSTNDDRLRIALVVGRISWFLDTTPATENEIAAMEAYISQLMQEIEIMQSRLDAVGVEERLSAILDNINYEMTILAKTLKLEHQYPYKLDPKALTVSISRPSAPIVMGQNLGSGSNYLGVHLIALLALHKYFILEKRPVPNFLVLDQPSQVYFPKESYTDAEGNLLKAEDADLAAVRRMFDLLFDYCRELYPNLQIIVLEHAEFETEDFQNALLEAPWRNGNALIPTNWIEED